MERNENGYSNLTRTGRGEAPKNEWRCPGTGEEWQGTDMGFHTDTRLGMPPAECARGQLAMVYSPFQCWRMLYSADEALKHGTLFEELYKPLEDCKNG